MMTVPPVLTKRECRARISAWLNEPIWVGTTTIVLSKGELVELRTSSNNPFVMKVSLMRLFFSPNFSSKTLLSFSAYRPEGLEQLFAHTRYCRFFRADLWCNPE